MIVKSGLDSTIYLVAAYAFAIAVLGGYVGWSLLRIRELSRKQ